MLAPRKKSAVKGERREPGLVDRVIMSMMIRSMSPKEPEGNMEVRTSPSHLICRALLEKRQYTSTVIAGSVCIEGDVLASPAAST